MALHPHSVILIVLFALSLGACASPGMPDQATAGLAATDGVASQSVPATPFTPERQPTQTAPALDTPTPRISAPAEPSPEWATAAFRGAESISLAVGGDGTVYAAFGREGGLYVARSPDGGRSFEPPVLVSGDTDVWVLAVERPALATWGGAGVGLAWLEVLGSDHARVWYTVSADSGHSFEPPMQAAVSHERETVMMNLAFESEGHPLLAWLQNASLVVASFADDGAGFTEPATVDDVVCECCQPLPLVTGDRSFIGYRNVERTPDGTVRDIYVAASDDHGRTFSEPVRVSDAHWHLDACPIAGPALTQSGEHLYVAWMDGRNDQAANFSRTDIFVAASTDGGRTFSRNVQVTGEPANYHTLPVMAVDAAGGLHLAWETQEADQRLIHYTSSTDGGQTFARPQPVVAEGSGRTRPRSPTLVVTPTGAVVLGWVDRNGAQVGVLP